MRKIEKQALFGWRGVNLIIFMELENGKGHCVSWWGIGWYADTGTYYLMAFGRPLFWK